ncbi:MAG TPA: hypothetical protein VGX48_07025 [Pyrinomonadaceae bacterium]|jgi:hypothetical protein|nr:hypothetical protein [Pyrinomonadaceae bacterium]
MSHFSRLLSFALTLTFLATTAVAQQPAPQQAAKKPATKTVAAADPMEEVRRAAAASMVTALAVEARGFRDPVLRARVQARAADVLWEAEKEQARDLFRRAWEAATSADEQLGEKLAREASRRGPSSRTAGSIRREVLRLAARRDAELGNEFLAQLDEAKKADAGEATAAAAATAAASAGAAPAQPFNPDDPPTHMSQRLNLAQQLLQDGDTERAMQFADPALYPVNTFGMHFLNSLREKNAAAADQRFSSLLARAANDPAADANTVSLLSSYPFTPFLYITVRPTGSSHTRSMRGNPKPPQDLDPKLRAAFLNTAAQILLRPLPPADQDRSTSGRMGAYVVATRLAPLFEQFMPDKAPAIRARQSQLSQETAGIGGERDPEILTRGIVPEKPGEDRVQEALSRAASAKDSGERDRFYFEAAMPMVGRDPAKAREYANKIEDIDLRKQVLSFITFRLLQDAIRGKNGEDALKLAQSDELTTVQRVWALTEVAKLLTKTQPGRAVEALDKAVEEARRIDDASPDRARTLTGIATQLVELDTARAWELMNEVVKSANALPDYTGEDSDVVIRIQFKGGGAMTTGFNAEGFDLGGIFASLGRDNFDRASALAHTLKNEAARSAATLAVARGALVKKTERASN